MVLPSLVICFSILLMVTTSQQRAETMFQNAWQIIVKNHQFGIYLYCVWLSFFSKMETFGRGTDQAGREGNVSWYKKTDIFWRHCSASCSLTSLAPQLDGKVGWISETPVHPATAIAKPQSHGYRFPQQEEWQVQEILRSLVYSKSQERAKNTAGSSVLDN